MHTQGPIELSSAGHGSKDGIVLDEYFVRVPGDDVALAADIVDPATGKPSEANARRIVAMWNALQHVSTEVLESGAVTKASWELTQAQRQIEALTATKFEALPTDGLVWVCLNAEGFPAQEINARLGQLIEALRDAKEEGRTNARFILTASLWPGQMQIQALPDEELARIGLIRTSAAVEQREELLASLEGLFEIGNVFPTAIEAIDPYAGAFEAWEVKARAAIAKARGAV